MNFNFNIGDKNRLFQTYSDTKVPKLEDLPLVSRIHRQ